MIADPAHDMIRQLLEGQEAVVKTARQVLPLDQRGHDAATENLLTQCMQLHEKTARMLRRMFDGS